MPVVIPLADCIARPEEGGRIFPLRAHLEAVAAGCGRPGGSPAEKLGFLAGLLHDAAKSHPDWQAYIRAGERGKGPPHAPLGAALFAFCADHLIPVWAPETSQAEELRDLALDWTRSIYDHHGALRDLETDPPWEGAAPLSAVGGLAEACDLVGILALVAHHFPEMQAGPEAFVPWLEGFAPVWERRLRFGRDTALRREERRLGAGAARARALRLPQVAGRLVQADRTHAAGWQEASLPAEDAAAAATHLEEECRKRAEEDVAEGADPALVDARARLQRAAVDAYRAGAGSTFFSLLLPTGYGKTLSGLRVALEACRMGRCRRIVYVAPYLSILSQATGEIRGATGLEVFQHHHLTPAEVESDHDLEVMDTWQAPVVTTTFNQLFRALFPARAQECVRAAALREAFVLIDEPQIVDTAVWTLFLRGLALASRDWGCQVAFMTATLPPLEWGLQEQALPLAPPDVRPTGRFTIRWEEEACRARDVAKRVGRCAAQRGSVACVVNTVRDAVEVYQRLGPRIQAFAAPCLTAMMLPAHKAAVIRDIRERQKAGRPVAAVCTQILEAGVHLSFRDLLRALPIFPSIAQASGRANRNGSGERAVVQVFPLVREDGVEARRYVYRDETARRHTDTILRERQDLPEEDVGQALQDYFRRCNDENRNTACLEKLEKAARGDWTALAGIEPFGGGPPRVEVFVPLDGLQLDAAMERLHQEFAPEGAEQLLARYLDRRFRRDLTFHQRKRLSALVQQYLVPLSQAQAEAVAEPVNEWLWRLVDAGMYCPKTGLAHLCASDAEETQAII